MSRLNVMDPDGDLTLLVKEVKKPEDKGELADAQSIEPEEPGEEEQELEDEEGIEDEGQIEDNENLAEEAELWTQLRGSTDEITVQPMPAIKGL
jgi:hypothetical protein